MYAKTAVAISRIEEAQDLEVRRQKAREIWRENAAQRRFVISGQAAAAQELDDSRIEEAQDLQVRRQKAHEIWRENAAQHRFVMSGQAAAQRWSTGLPSLVEEPEPTSTESLPNCEEPKLTDLHATVIQVELPSTIIFKGESIEGLQKKPLRLVSTLLDMRDNKSQIPSLAEPVWDDPNETVGKEALSSAKKKANAFFVKHGIPLKVVRKGDFVMLKLIGPVKSP